MKFFIYSILALFLMGAAQAKVFKKGDHIIFFGDSITQMGDQPGGYVSLIREAVNSQYGEGKITVTGKGVSGNKVGNLLQRVERDVLKNKPTHVFLFIGTNDVWHWARPHPVTKKAREGTSPEDYKAGLEELIRLFKENGIKVVISPPAAIGENVLEVTPEKERLEQYCEIVREVANDQQVPVIDLRKKFVDYLSEHNSQQKERGILTKDGVHLNGEGNKFVAKAFCDFARVTVKEESDSSFASEGPEEIYLLIGQSNMAGRARITENESKPIRHCQLFNDAGEWGPAENPLNRYSTIRKELEMQKLGLGYGFGKEMVKAYKNKKTIGLVVNAKGGSKIASWMKGEPFYADAIARVKAATEGSKLTGVLWHQGESDANNPEYLKLLQQLIKNLRKDLKSPDLPFIAGEIFKDEPVNELINQLPNVVENTAVVKSRGLQTQDGTHFDTESQLELGQRYAKEMLSLLGE